MPQSMRQRIRTPPVPTALMFFPSIATNRSILLVLSVVNTLIKVGIRTSLIELELLLQAYIKLMSIDFMV